MKKTRWFWESPLVEISFDRYQRFRAVAELVNKLQPEGLEILNLCDEDGGFPLFAPNHTVISLAKERDADITDLPYKDRIFDVVVCIDLLEHVEKYWRKACLAEMVRVVRHQVILAGPVETSRAAEELLFRLTQNPYLREHLEIGLPERIEIEKI